MLVYGLFFNGIQHLLLLLSLEYMGELPDVSLLEVTLIFFLEKFSLSSIAVNFSSLTYFFKLNFRDK